MRTGYRYLCVVLVALLSLTAEANADQLTVVRVVDGDTYELSDGSKVRLIGVDTPESHYSYKLMNDVERSHREREIIQEYGSLATLYAMKLVLGKPVQLVYDDANAATGHRDRFGRTLAYINVLDEEGNSLYCLNDRLIFDGYANTYVKYPFARMEWYRAAEGIARTEGRGFWNPGFDTTNEEQRLQPVLKQGEVVYVTRTGSKYHRATCSSLRRSKIKLEPGHKGHYDACKICKPPQVL